MSMQAQDRVTVDDAYRAMYEFLMAYHDRGPTKEVAILLSGLNLADDGKPMDPAYWGDWVAAVERVLARPDRRLSLPRAIEAMLDELLTEGAVDWIQAYEVAWVAQSKGNAATPEEIRELSVQLIGELLARGDVEVGDVTEAGFRSWGMSVTDALARVDRDWRALPRAPTLGDVCWLNLTTKGEAEAAALSTRTR